MQVKGKKKNGSADAGAEPGGWKSPGWLRAAAGLALIPFSSALLRTLWVAERELGTVTASVMSAAAGMFTAGAGVALVLCVAFRHSPRPYVVAHELSHAVFGWLCGARVSGLKLAKAGGSVRVSKDNALILLGPYFLPFHAVLLLLLSAPLSLAAPAAAEPVFGRAMDFAAGAAWGWHFCWTVNALSQRQQDLEEYGYFFSFNFIIAANLLVLCLFFGLLTPMPWARLASIARAEAASVFGWLANFAAGAAWRLRAARGWTADGA